jgi:hypothetical protein
MTTPVPTSDWPRVLGAAATDELRQAATKIAHCLNQLTDAQLWWRPDESQNSIGNLILHLCGNLRQWVVSGLGGAPDVRDRPREFSERRSIPRAELLSRLDAVVAEAATILSGIGATQWLQVRRVQGFEVTGIAAIFDTVPHFRGHTQEIIFRTRLLLGDKYQFSWKPATPEQGA